MSLSDRHMEIQNLLSAYLDGELTQADSQRVRLHVEDCGECQTTLEEMAALQHLTAEIKFAEPPDDLLDALEQRVSVQAPRRFGWGLIITALAAWAVYVAIQAARHFRWPTIPELLAGVVVAGIVLLFVSVLRQRLLERPHDRYRKVRR